MSQLPLSQLLTACAQCGGRHYWATADLLGWRGKIAGREGLDECEEWRRCPYCRAPGMRLVWYVYDAAHEVFRWEPIPDDVLAERDAFDAAAYDACCPDDDHDVGYRRSEAEAEALERRAEEQLARARGEYEP